MVPWTFLKLCDVTQRKLVCYENEKKNYAVLAEHKEYQKARRHWNWRNLIIVNLIK